MSLPIDTFTCFVEYTSGEGAFREIPKVSRVLVDARTENEATLTALELVACHGCPVSVEVDYENF